MKNFLKNNAVKSIAVLLGIALLSATLLSVCNDLLFVSEEEKLARSIAKIYGGSAQVEATLSITDENAFFAKGEVNSAYLMSDGNYLVQSTGKGAYNGGTITAWVVILSQNGQVNGVGKVLFHSTTVSSFFAVSEGFLDGYSQHGGEVSEGKYFSVDGSEGIAKPYTGATYSANGYNNAVNCALQFIQGELGLTQEKLPYENYILPAQSTVSVAEDTQTVEYRLAIKANPPAPAFTLNITVQNGAITAYSHEGNYASNGYFADLVDPSILNYSKFLGMDITALSSLLNEEGALDMNEANLTTGATYSTEGFIYGAAFALFNAQHFLQGGTLS